MRLTPLIIFLSIMVLGCKSDYEELVEVELAKNIRQDSIFMGLQFGMTDRQFFAHCWELNRAGVVTNGRSNMSVLYQMEEFGKKYDVNFYPRFNENKIYSLPVEYSYEAFAPWNPRYSLDSLFEEVSLIYRVNFGDDCLSVPDPNGGVALVWVDANRRVSVYKDARKNAVVALFRDLSVKIEEEEEG